MPMPAIPFIHAIALMLKRLSGNWISVSQDKGNIHLKIGCVPECNTIKMTVVLYIACQMGMWLQAYQQLWKQYYKISK